MVVRLDFSTMHLREKADKADRGADEHHRQRRDNRCAQPVARRDNRRVPRSIVGIRTHVLLATFPSFSLARDESSSRSIVCLSMIFSENRYPLFRIMLQRDDFSSNRHPAPSFCLSMIFAQTLRVCREGKPVPTFPDHALSAFRPSGAWRARYSC